MKIKKYKKALIILIILFVIFSLYNFRYLVVPLILQSEKIGFEEIKTMYISKTDKSNKYVNILDNNNNEITIPLPIGSVEFYNEQYPKEDGKVQYLIPSDEYKPYINESLIENNFKISPENREIFYSTIDEEISYSMIVDNYTRYFYIITFSIK